jgi:hypothetical protein
MYEIQRRFRHRWESQDRWQLISRHETIARCSIGIVKNICSSVWDGAPGNPDNYRIALVNKRGKVVETYDAYGKQTSGFLAKPHPLAKKKRQLVAA